MISVTQESKQSSIAYKFLKEV
jgi:hypothetical protein